MIRAEISDIGDRVRRASAAAEDVRHNPIDPADPVALPANVDVFVDLPDGSSWALTIFTVDEVRRLLDRWKQTGEVANGSYFWAVGQVIVPHAGVPAMTAAIRELVRSGQIVAVGVRCADEG